MRALTTDLWTSVDIHIGFQTVNLGPNFQVNVKTRKKNPATSKNPARQAYQLMDDRPIY